MLSNVLMAVGRSRWRFALASVAVMALAAGLRCHALSGRSLWSDEYLSLECSSGWGRSDLRVAASHEAAPDLVGLAHARPWTQIWPSVARDENHPPLYFLLLRGWRAAFGDSAAAIRSLSVLASVAAVGWVVAAGDEAAGPAAGLWGGVLMAVAVPEIHEGQDARAYALVTAASAAALLAMVRIARRGPTGPRAAGLFVALLALPLLHYMALATVGTVALFAAVGLRGPSRRLVLGVAAAALAAYAACWGTTMVAQHHRMLAATEWLTDPAAGHVGRTLAHLVGVPVRLVLDPDGPVPPVATAAALLALLAPPAVLWATRRRPAAAAPPLLLLWLWMAVPIAVAAVIDLSTRRHSLSMVKYTLAGAPGLYLIVGQLAATGRRLAWVPAAALAVACGPYLADVYHPPAEPDWRPLARSVADRSGPDDPVVLISPAGPVADESSGMRVVGLEYCLAAAGRPRPLYVLDGFPAGPARLALGRARRMCVVAGGMDPGALTQFLPGTSLSDADLFLGLGVIGVARRTPLPPVASGTRASQGG